MKLKNKDIQMLVVKHLTMVLKKRCHYFLFRCFVDHRMNDDGQKSTVYSLDIFPSFRKKHRDVKFRDDNPFYYCPSADNMCDVLDTLDNFRQRRVKKDFSVGSDNAAIQEKVMKYLNILLHHCLERGLNDLDMVQEIGNEVFEATCKDIFGDDFVDETEKVSEEARKMLNPEMIKTIINNYANGGSVDGLSRLQELLSQIRTDMSFEIENTAPAPMDDCTREDDWTWEWEFDEDENENGRPF